MSALTLVVADTTPLNYLIILDRTDVLRALFGEVLIPEAVMRELRHPKAPAAVRSWLHNPPTWLRVVSVQQLDQTIQLGDGENEAISLAIENQAKVILMDERRGRAAAEARGLIPLGTLNLFDLADEASLLDGIQALRELRKTTFRAASALLDRFEQKMLARRVKI